MPKIPGLKKKKKGKKNKHKTEEEFDAEELEKYRKEHQKPAEEASTSSDQPKSSSEQSDEWQKFKALTAGVDNILKKTHDDLDRIKQTSYFQRKPPGPSEYGTETSKGDPKEKSWTEFEEGQDFPDADTFPDGATGGTEQPFTSVELKFEEYDEDDEEEDSEADEDLFDTTFVDIVAAEDLHLAYIPDSPIEEEEGPDPFDTSIVDKVIKPETEKERKRKLVSLGCAVDVLAGKLDKAISPLPEHHESTPRRRPKPLDLLLGSFDEQSPKAKELENAAAAPVETPIKTLLDEDVDISLPLTPVDVEDTISILQKINESVQKTQVVERPEKRVTPVLEQFGIDELLEDEDEFAALATESLAKSPVVCDSKFAPLKPQRPPLPSNLNKESDLDFDSVEDPFDTSFAERVLPGRCEIQIIESEILEKDESELIPSGRVEFDGKTIKYSGVTIEINSNPLTKENQEEPTLKKDLLGGSTTDLSQLSSVPIEPVLIDDEVEDIGFAHEDPFDTSIVNTLTAPGKTELKFLEQELLSETSNFELKTEEKVAHRPDQLIGTKKNSISKVVAFIEPPGVNGTDEPSKKPVTPYYPGKSFESESLDFLTAEDDIAVKLHTPVVPKKIEDELEFIDPFDTSIASNIQPSNTELKLIESELMSTPEIEVSDPFEITNLK